MHYVKAMSKMHISCIVYQIGINAIPDLSVKSMSRSKTMETDQPEKEPSHKSDKMFTLKKWNLVAMWSWDVECDTCAICRVQVMGKILV